MVVYDEDPTTTVECYAILRSAFDRFHPTESHVPSSRVLSYFRGDGDGIKLLPFLVSPQLESMDLFIYDGHPSILAPVMAALSIEAPILSDIGVDGLAEGRKVIVPPTPSQAALQNLRRVNCDATMTDSIMAVLASLPHLNSIDCCLPRGPLSLPYPDHASHNLFPSLQHVHLYV